MVRTDGDEFKSRRLSAKTRRRCRPEPDWPTTASTPAWATAALPRQSKRAAPRCGVLATHPLQHPSIARLRGIVSTASCGGEECGRALQNIHATGGPAWTRWAAPGTRPVDGASADAAPAAAAVAALGAAATVSQRQWEGLRWPSRALRWSGARYTRREERPAGLCARGLGSTRQRWRRMENQWTSGRRRRVSPSHERIRPSRQRDEPPGGLDVHIPLAKIP